LNREPTAFSTTKCAAFSPLRPNRDANLYSGTALIASAAVILSSRQTSGVGGLMNALLAIAVVTAIGRILGALRRDRRTGIVTPQSGMRLTGIIGFESWNGAASQET